MCNIYLTLHQQIKSFQTVLNKTQIYKVILIFHEKKKKFLLSLNIFDQTYDCKTFFFIYLLWLILLSKKLNKENKNTLYMVIFLQNLLNIFF